MEVVQLTRSRAVMYQRQTSPVQRKLFGGRRNSVIGKRWQKVGVLSRDARRKLERCCSTLFELSLARPERSLKGKVIPKFRAAFVTLTLPAPQVHTDKELKELALNQFLTELRTSNGLRNYVWKAEIQTNGNLHFHLLIDQFIDYYDLRKKWNRVIGKLGYVDRYSERMRSLTIADYIQLRISSMKGWKRLTLEEQQVQMSSFLESYDSGMSSGWLHPNSVDVKLVRSGSGLSYYLQKYVSKNLTSSDNPGEVDAGRLEKFGRLWGASYSLTRYRPVTTMHDGSVWSVYEELRRLPKVVKFKRDYVRGVYYQLVNVTERVRRAVNELVFANAIRQGYCYPVIVNVNSC
jgi:hypothetical protein